MTAKTFFDGDEVEDTRDLAFIPADPTAARTLTSQQVEQFNRDGFLNGLPAFDADEIATIRAYVDDLLAQVLSADDLRNSYSINAYHLVCAGLYDLLLSPVLLDYVEDILGPDFGPVKGDALMINIGQRYDVLVEATGEGLNWMRYKPFGPPVDGPEGRSVLRYKGTEGSEPAESAGATPSAQIDVMKLRSLDSTDLSGEKPREIEMVLGGGPKGKSTATPYRWSIGDQYWPSSEQYVVDEGENIRFVLTNPTPMPHPFHLHGHSFNVLGDPAGPILQSPVLRDTVTVPPSGAIAVQVAADNPGKWIWHCHIDWHLATGMARVVRYSSIDDLESRQFPKGTLT